MGISAGNDSDSCGELGGFTSDGDSGIVAMPGGAGPHLPLVPPAEARAFTPKNVPCLRNCIHYMSVLTPFDHGNPAGTFAEGKEPLQRQHLCTAVPGVFLELSADSPVYECEERFEPRIGVNPLIALREKYYEQHPEHRPDGPIQFDESEDHAADDAGNGDRGDQPTG